MAQLTHTKFILAAVGLALALIPIPVAADGSRIVRRNGQDIRVETLSGWGDVMDLPGINLPGNTYWEPTWADASHWRQLCAEYGGQVIHPWGTTEYCLLGPESENADESTGNTQALSPQQERRKAKDEELRALADERRAENEERRQEAQREEQQRQDELRRQQEEAQREAQRKQQELRQQQTNAAIAELNGIERRQATEDAIAELSVIAEANSAANEDDSSAEVAQADTTEEKIGSDGPECFSLYKKHVKGTLASGNLQLVATNNCDLPVEYGYIDLSGRHRGVVDGTKTNVDGKHDTMDWVNRKVTIYKVCYNDDKPCNDELNDWYEEQFKSGK